MKNACRVLLALLLLLGGSLLPAGAELPFRLPEGLEPGQDGGVVAGRVQDSSGKGLYGASIKINGSERARTDHRGGFRISGVPAGEHGITVYLSGYRTAKGTVSLGPGESRDILISLSSISGDPPGQSPQVRRTRLTIQAHPFRSDGARYTVRRIEVTEQGGAGRTWKNTWYRTYDSYVELPCDDAEFGRYYRVTVTWYNWRSRDEVTSSWEPRVWRDSQKESYSRP